MHLHQGRQVWLFCRSLHLFGLPHLQGTHRCIPNRLAQRRLGGRNIPFCIIPVCLGLLALGIGTLQGPQMLCPRAVMYLQQFITIITDFENTLRQRDPLVRLPQANEGQA